MSVFPEICSSKELQTMTQATTCIQRCCFRSGSLPASAQKRKRHAQRIAKPHSAHKNLTRICEFNNMCQGNRVYADRPYGPAPQKQECFDMLDSVPPSDFNLHKTVECFSLLPICTMSRKFARGAANASSARPICMLRQLLTSHLTKGHGSHMPKQTYI